MSGGKEIIHISGVKISLVNVDDILSFFTESVDSRRQVVLASLNMHGLYVHSKSAAFRELHNSADTMVHIDGMPIVWLIKLLGLTSTNVVRTGWIDWVYQFLALAADRHWRIYYLGSSDEVMLRGISRIRDRFPNLIIDGHSGFFDKTIDGEESQEVVKIINDYRADILVVGMGMGVQETWIHHNRESLEVSAIATSGACMEILAGDLSVPPLFFRRFGLEWFYRLCKTPKRVYRRYLIEPFFVAWYLITKGSKK